MKKLLLSISLCLTLLAKVHAGGIEVYNFDNKKQEDTYKELVDELRCLVCQNQNIASSNAELAQDMRRKTAALLKEGKSKTEITDFMTDRYGEFVNYKPRFNAKNIVLWLGPFVIFALAAWLMWRTIHARKQDNELNELSDDQVQQAASFLQSNTDKDKNAS